MANENPIFRVLESSAGNGVGWDVAVDATTAAAALNGGVGFSFKDSSGNVILPALTAAGKIPVDIVASGGVCKTHHLANDTGGTSYIDLAEITGALTKVYSGFGITVSSMRDSEFELVYIDDDGGTPTETILGTYHVGSGSYTVCCELSCTTIDTTGGTNVQTFLIRGKNLNKASRMAASLSFTET
jgi:hypothetical protein